jgi:N-methylhydantoinase B
MDTVLAASALSPVIADAWDRASGVFHPKTGEVIAQGSTGLPIFIVVMQQTVQAVLKHHPPETMKDGDVFIVNDPYCGGTHTMDVKFVKPYFRNGEIKGIVANTGHWPDVGGMTPGGFTAAATDIYQEGLRLPPVKIVEAGVLNKTLVDIIVLNMRVAEERRGDISAHLNALDLGCKRLGQMFDRYSEEMIFACIDELKASSERLMRKSIQEIPDGDYHFVDLMDNDGVDFDPIRIDVKMSVRGDEILFDLSGSSPECRGPLNCPVSASISALMIGIKHVFWDIPINSGCFEPIKYIIPEGTVFNPRPPKAVSGTTTETAHRLVCGVIGAMSQAIPDRVPAGSFGTGTIVSLGGKNASGSHFATIFFFGGGYGGYAGGDGLTNGSALIAASRNPSIEVLEQSVPVLFTKHAIRENSAGRGEWRGGSGVEVEFRLLEGEAYMTIVSDRGREGPPGLLGGEPGAPSDHELRAEGKAFKPPHGTKIERLYIRGGDGALLRTPGGGGYGHPDRRKPELAQRDQAAGIVAA